MSIQTIGGVEATPILLAHLFWGMSSDEQADFFAALEGIAGYKLCIQMAAVVHEISERADKGDFEAMNGFQTMLSHAQEYHDASTGWRVAKTKWELQDIRDRA